MNKQYWINRYNKYGLSYVGKGNNAQHAAKQAEELSPILEGLLVGPKLLDYGCGPGRFRSLIESCGIHYTGVDVIPNFSELPLDAIPNDFDCVLISYVLQHIVEYSEYANTVKELYRVVKPGGRVIVVDCNFRRGKTFAAHMRPRGPEMFQELAPWEAFNFVGELEDHWIGYFTRGDKELPKEQEPVFTPATSHQRALVLGGGAEIWDDYKRLLEIVGEWDGLVIAVNDIACHWPYRLDHWVTLHPERLKTWKDIRKKKGYSSNYITWSRRPDLQIDKTVQPWSGGSSGLLAVNTALAEGRSRIVLCGVPMTRSPHFQESFVHKPKADWTSADGHWKIWQRYAGQMKHVVRSMSGRTRDLLGEPTLEWLGLQPNHEHPLVVEV